MRCAVHTLQLAIRDGLKDQHASNLISKLRQVAVAARTPKIDSIIKRRAGKGAILDQTTRWGSTYLMIQRLVELRAVLEDIDNPSITLTEHQWSQAKEMSELLLMPYLTTKQLQAEELTGGQFLYEWKSLIFKLSKKGSLIADGIVKSMKKREAQMMENEILLAVTFIDPKHRILLEDDQCTMARQCLCNLAVEMEGIELDGDIQNIKIELVESQSSSSSNDAETFEQHLKRMQKGRNKAKKMKLDATTSQPFNMKVKKFKEDFNKAMDQVEEIEVAESNRGLSLQDFIAGYPEIVRGVASTIAAFPATQVSVERLFSALKIMKSDLRSSLKEDIVEAILFFLNYNCN